MTSSRSAPDSYAWLTPEFYSTAYHRFIQLRWKANPFDGENIHLDPHDYRFSEAESEKIPGSAFSCLMCKLSIERLSGELNTWSNYLVELKTWEEILPDYTESQRLHLFCEFVEPRMVLCLGAPNALKNQMIFTGTKIAILFEKGRLHSKLPEDERISAKDFRKWAGAWDGFGQVEQLLNKINGVDFANSTKAFRNRYHHRIPPRIELGLTPDFTFENNRSYFTMRLSPEEPLPLTDAINASVCEHRASLAAFREFWGMIKRKVS